MLTFGMKIQVFIFDNQVARSNKLSHYPISLLSESKYFDTGLCKTNYKTCVNNNNNKKGL